MLRRDAVGDDDAFARLARTPMPALRSPQQPRLTRPRVAIAMSIVIASLALSACGGSSDPSTATRASAAIDAANAAGSTQTSASDPTTAASSTVTSARAAESSSGKAGTTTSSAGSSSAGSASSSGATSGSSGAASASTSTPSSTLTSTSSTTRPASLSAGAAADRKAPPRVGDKKSKPKAKLPSPSSCLRFAGLGHIRRVKAGTWQGTIGNKSTSDINGSVFVNGPYGSVRAAAGATRSIGRTDVAIRGGRYVAYATRKSYLDTNVSTTAACLSAGGHSYSF